MGVNETLTEHLRHVILVLQDAHIPYALAGGLAYSALVEPRATVDIDLLILIQETAMASVFRRLASYFDTLIVHPKPMRFPLVQIWRAVGIVQRRELILDFLLVESEFHRTALNRARVLDFMGIQLHIVTVEDLILLKRCANRAQDVADVQMIYRVFDPELDHAYLTFWEQQLKVSETIANGHDV